MKSKILNALLILTALFGHLQYVHTQQATPTGSTINNTMKSKTLNTLRILTALFGHLQYAHTQQATPTGLTMNIVRASSPNVAIKDGDFLDKNAWTLSPEARPDVYTADRCATAKWVTFYTDIDSIKVKVKPGTVFDFVIVLNGKDSCFTRIVSAAYTEPTLRKRESPHDTIPFTLTTNNAIHVKGIVNNHDTLDLHFDLGTLDFRLTKDGILNKTSLLTDKNKPDFNHLNKINTLQIGNMIWDNPNVRVAGNAARGMDGRFGWRVFNGKVVEIDYDRQWLIVHAGMPKKKKGYVKSDIRFIQSLLCIPATIEVEGRKYTGNFLCDTGSDLAMVLDSVWMSQQHFPNNLTVIKKSSFSDGAGRRYQTNIVSVPTVQVNGFTVKDIPTSELGYESPAGSGINYFGNDLLKRFNVLIDLKNDHIYLKPNHLMGVSFKGNS